MQPTLRYSSSTLRRIVELPYHPIYAVLGVVHAPQRNLRLLFLHHQKATPMFKTALGEAMVARGKFMDKMKRVWQMFQGCIRKTQ
jgi:hypothetical protein